MAETSYPLVQPQEISFYNKLGDRIQQTQATIPTNDKGLPTAYIDAAKLAALDVADDPLEAAVPLSYLEGFPSQNGLPFWERLENEPIEEYNLFKAYRDLPDDPTNETGVRSIAKVAERANLPVRYLYALAKVRHWQVRALAHDYYRQQVIETKRRREIEKMEGKHVKAAKELFELAMDFFRNNPEQINGKVAVEALKLAAQLHRVSLGLPADKPPSEVAGNNGGTIISITATQQNIGTGADSLGMFTQRESESKLLQVLQILKQSGALPTQWQHLVDANLKPNTNPDTNPDTGTIDIVNDPDVTNIENGTDVTYDFTPLESESESEPESESK